MLYKAGGWVASWVKGWLGIDRGGYAQDYTRGDMSPAIELSSGASPGTGGLGAVIWGSMLLCILLHQKSGQNEKGRERMKGGRGQGPVQILSPRNGSSLRPLSGFVLTSACVTLPVGSAINCQEVME